MFFKPKFLTSVSLLPFLFLLLLWPLMAQEEVAISEVAWSGTEASSADEYLELKGPPGLDLTGWRLEALDGSPGVTLTGLISDTGFFLLERTDDDAVASLPADQIYTGALEDGGEHLLLRDSAGHLVDEIDASLGWPAGDGNPRAALERLDLEFVTNDCAQTSGALDAGGNPICGSPGAENQAPGPVSAVRFVRIPPSVALSQTTALVAQAWNASGQPPQGSTMQFSIVSSGTGLIAIDPPAATISAGGQATVTVTGLSTGTAIVSARWAGNWAGAEVRVAPPGSPGSHRIYLPLIIR